MKTIKKLIDEIKQNHFPNSPCDDEVIDFEEKRLCIKLPDDMRLFYKNMNGASLHEKEDSPYEIIPLNEIQRTRIDILGEDNDEAGPEEWLSICYVRDGNYVSFEILDDDKMIFIDSFHETFAIEEYSTVIAKSFTEFLSHCLNSDSLYWCDKGFSDYGDAFEYKTL